MSKSLRPNRGTRAVTRIQNPQGNRENYLRLDKNERTVPLPNEIIRTANQSLTNDALCVYPETSQLIETIAHFHSVDPSKILLTAGSDAAIKSCFETFMEWGEELVTLTPTFAMVDVYAKLFGAQNNKINYNGDLELDYNALLGSISNRTRLIVIANPNSPTGTTIRQARLLELAKRALEVNSFLVIDEAYYPFSTETAIDLLEDFDNIAIARSFSKAMGLATVRGGYLIGSEKAIEYIGRWRPMYEINGFAVAYGMALFKHWDQVEKYAMEVREAREWFATKLRSLGYQVFPSDANFLLVRFPTELIDAAVLYFRKNKILINKGGGTPPLLDTLRFTVGTKPQMLKCFKAFQKFIDSLLKK